VTVEVLQKQRLTRHAIGEGAAKQQRAEIVLGGGNRNGQSARVTQNSSDGPAADGCPRRPVWPKRRQLVIERDRKCKRLGLAGETLLVRSVEDVVDHSGDIVESAVSLPPIAQLFLPRKRRRYLNRQGTDQSLAEAAR
jgi:hypothetical protein